MAVGSHTSWPVRLRAYPAVGAGNSFRHNGCAGSAIYFACNWITCSEDAGRLWLNFAPVFLSGVFTGAILFGAERVFVSAGLLPDSDTSVPVFSTLVAPVRLISTGCVTQDAFTSFRYTARLVGSRVTE